MTTTGRVGVLVALAVVAAHAVALQAQVRPGPPAKPPAGQTQSGTIRGRVVDSLTDLGLGQVDVQAVAAAANVARLARTDQSGAYTVEGLPPGRYALRASRSAYITGDLVEGADASGEPRIVVIGAGEAIEVPDIRLSRGGVIEGRVVDQAGEPMVSATVEAMTVVQIGEDEVPTAYAVGLPGRETDDRGRYRLFALPPGTYVVRVNVGAIPLPGGQKVSLFEPTFFPNARELSGARTVMVGSGEEVPDVDIVLVPAGRVSRSGLNTVVARDFSPTGSDIGRSVSIMVRCRRALPSSRAAGAELL